MDLNKLKVSFPLLLAMLGALGTAALFIARAEARGSQVEDHEQRIRPLEKTVIEMGGDIKAVKRILEKQERNRERER